MAIVVKLEKKVAGGKWKASGTITGRGYSGPCEVLLKEVEPSSVLPILDSSLVITKFMGRDVSHFFNANPTPVKEKLSVGLEITLSDFWFRAKKTK